MSEAAIAEMIGTSFMGGEAEAPASEERTVFEFDEDFQTKIAALAVRDTNFLKNTEGLLQPQFFENMAEAAVVNTALKFYEIYKKAPGDKATFVQLIKEDMAAKVIRSDMKAPVVDTIRAIYGEGVDLSDRDFVVDKVEEFARHQAVANAILNSVDLLERRDFTKIEKSMKQALETGANRGQTGYDFFAEAGNRAQKRRDMLSGKIKPNGITTGIKVIDDRLYHKGWGRKELSTILGGAKAGKTTALINFGKSACFAGYNVLYVSLEVSEEIVSDRLEASISGHKLNELAVNLNDIEEKIYSLKDRVGAFKIHRFPTGSMKPSDLRRVLEMYRAHGMSFDLIVVDYAQIMAPEHRTSDNILNSKSIHEDLRAIADEYDAAVLTATQTNRDGFQSSVVKAEHTSDDFNIVRICDLMISINKTEEEAENSQARLYFAASRNQAGGFTLKIEQDLERARFITKILGAE